MSATLARAGSARKGDEALNVLRQNILNGTWPINSKIPKEAELMEVLGVGKSTVREAVRSLVNLGMLEPIKGVGTFVRSLTPVSAILTQFVSGYSLPQILVYRRALEIEAVQQAAANRSDEQLAALRSSYEFDSGADPCAPVTPSRGQMPGSFHHLIFEAADNPLLASMFSGVMGAIRQAMASREIVFGCSHSLRLFDHGQILEAIEQQDVARAAHVMAVHVDRDLVPDDGSLADLSRSGQRELT